MNYKNNFQKIFAKIKSIQSFTAFPIVLVFCCFASHCHKLSLWFKAPQIYFINSMGHNLSTSWLPLQMGSPGGNQGVSHAVCSYLRHEFLFCRLLTEYSSLLLQGWGPCLVCWLWSGGCSQFLQPLQVLVVLWQWERPSSLVSLLIRTLILLSQNCILTISFNFNYLHEVSISKDSRIRDWGFSVWILEGVTVEDHCGK